MPRITKVYTRTGDAGTTRLGSGEEVPKDDLRVAAYGTVDELNSLLGLVLAGVVATELRDELGRIQSELFDLGAVLCVKVDARDPQGGDDSMAGLHGVADARVERLEKTIDRLQQDLEPLAEFVLPGGTVAAATLHVARTVCRRAERLVVSLTGSESVDPGVIKYLNRLSDLLFVMARWDNRNAGREDVYWKRS